MNIALAIHTVESPEGTTYALTIHWNEDAPIPEIGDQVFVGNFGYRPVLRRYIRPGITPHVVLHFGDTFHDERYLVEELGFEPFAL